PRPPPPPPPLSPTPSLPDPLPIFLGDQPVPYAKHVDTADVAAGPVLDPGIHPTHDAAVAGGEYLLGVEMGVRRARKQLLPGGPRSEEHRSELQSRGHLVCRLLLEK